MLGMLLPVLGVLWAIGYLTTIDGAFGNLIFSRGPVASRKIPGGSREPFMPVNQELFRSEARNSQTPKVKIIRFAIRRTIPAE